MIEVRNLTDKEKARHKSMDYVIDLGHTKQWFTKKALIELSKKIEKFLNEETVSEEKDCQTIVNCDHLAYYGKDICKLCKYYM